VGRGTVYPSGVALIYVVMASLLEPYRGAADNRIYRFKRSISSFLGTFYPDKTLVVVSDGCPTTSELCHTIYKDFLTLIETERHTPHSGLVRQAGIDYVHSVCAPGDIVAYLDTDDEIGQDHLKKIQEHFGDNDWILWDMTYRSPDGDVILEAAPFFERCGAGGLAHRADLDITWPSGYGNDGRLVESLAGCDLTYEIFHDMQYYIHHSIDWTT